MANVTAKHRLDFYKAKQRRYEPGARPQSIDPSSTVREVVSDLEKAMDGMLKSVNLGPKVFKTAQQNHVRMRLSPPLGVSSAVHRLSTLYLIRPLS